jgi:hypothetical protein
MSEYVDKERVAGERRMDALFTKKTEFLCPGYTQKSMSLCIRQYIKNYKVETASSYFSLSHFIQIAANQDNNAKVFDSVTAQLISFETMTILQENLKKEDLICFKMKPSGPQNLLEIKQVCANEESQFRQYQEKNKNYIKKKLLEIETLMSDADTSSLGVWKKNKHKELAENAERQFDKKFLKESDSKISSEDILAQHKTTIAVSCKNLSSENKMRFSKVNSCEQKLSSILFSCIDAKMPREPASLKEKDIIKMVQEPLPCFYENVQKFLLRRK